MTTFRLILVLMLGFLVGCSKPNPNPELLDPIYQDIDKERKSVESAIKSTEKELEGFEKDLKNVQPQTGQVKYATKRVYESRAKLQQLKQEQTYLKIKLESRRDQAFLSYMKAYNSGKEWPDTNDFKDYQASKQMQGSDRVWNPKKRLEKYQNDLRNPASKY